MARLGPTNARRAVSEAGGKCPVWFGPFLSERAWRPTLNNFGQLRDQLDDNRGRSRRATRAEIKTPWSKVMPRTVVIFERLAYLSIFLGVLAACNGIYQASHQGLDAFNIDLVGAGGLVITASCMIDAALIFAAARRRQNWARWVYSVLLALAVVQEIVTAVRSRDIIGFDPGTLLGAASDIAAIASIYFAFSRPSNSWFRAQSPAGEAVAPIQGQYPAQ